MEYYAHTAVRADGKPDPDTAKWLVLSAHLRSACSFPGPIAPLEREDTMPNFVCFIAPMFSVAKGIFQSVLRWKSVNVRPTRCNACASVPFRRHAFNHPGSGSGFGGGAAPRATENHVIPARN